MITIRYAALPEGLHARAEAQGRRTVIYLRPGLTAEQRRLSLRRARHSARMGYGPRLSGPGVALAVARHVAAGTLRNVAAAVRRHPIGFLLLSAGFAALVTWYALFVTVSVRLMLDPARAPAALARPLPARVVPAAQAPGQGAVPAPAPAFRAVEHASRARPDNEPAVARAAGRRPAGARAHPRGRSRPRPRRRPPLRPRHPPRPRP